jgi:uncharacterized damage-inducible protein DinB
MCWTSSFTSTNCAAVLCAQWFGGGFGTAISAARGLDVGGGLVEAALVPVGGALVLAGGFPVPDAQAVSRAAASAAAPSIAVLILPNPSRGACDAASVTSFEEPVPARWSAATERPDMWIDAAADPRDTGNELKDERATLTEYLRAYRLTLEMKCADLDAEQLARRSVPPSSMSLLGLVRHMADVERSWFRRTLAGQDAPTIYCAEDRDGDFNGAVAEAEVVADAWRAWREEVAFAEQFTDATDLSAVGRTRHGDTISLREVLVHMIEEYARHCGHADLLRERIDGRVGQ